jgi:hypothetical protein
MQALALLCNLHADGPATLQRLRRAGYESVSSVLDLEPERLASVAGWQRDAAERFLREARCLAERLDEGLLEEDEGVEPVEALPPARRELGQRSAPERRTEEHEGASEPRMRALVGPESRARASEPVLARVLGAWRDLDRTDPPEPPRLLVPQPPPGTGRGTPLSDARIEGLDRERIERLVRARIPTLEALAATRTLELARALGVGFTRAARLQLLARRRLHDIAAASALHGAPARDPRPAGFGPPSPESTAGPFA